MPPGACAQGGTPPEFLARNTEAPFCYLVGTARSWRILSGTLADGDSIVLEARQADRVLASGPELDVSGLHIKVTREGRLQIDAAEDVDMLALNLEVALERQPGKSVSQRLEVRAAPPPRPISYVSDLTDDLIRIFWNAESGTFRPIERNAFDQYFRRLQAHGVSRLIVWQNPYPCMTRASDHRPDDWERYERQARAIVDSPQLAGPLGGKGRLASWSWLRQILALRLNPEFGRMFADSAAAHGIALSASFRPFEPALTKYYEVPAFDDDGMYLWGFLPLATPLVNYHADEVGFAHYRTLLREMGQDAAAEPGEVELNGVANAAELARPFEMGELPLTIAASHFPPIDVESLVLVRASDGQFQLRRFAEIRDRAEAGRTLVDGFQLEADGPTTLRITGLSVPAGYRYLVLTNPTDAPKAIRATELTVRSQGGTPLGRLNYYWALPQSDAAGSSTHLAGITTDGEYRTTFQTTDNSINILRANPPAENFAGASLVIDLGRPWAVEMIDFQRPATRQLAITQLQTLLSLPAFDEIFINTRSHTQLAGCTGDGDEGIRTQLHYRLQGKNYAHLGIDRAYAPRSLAENDRLRRLVVDAQSIGRITQWQAGEWQQPCDSADSSYVWRFERKHAIADGVRLLLADIEQNFPGVRVRVVVPPTDSTIERLQAGLDEMHKPDGTLYGRDYYHHIWSSLNYIPEIGDGMSMADFSGLSVEPVFLGIRFAPDDQPLDLYLAHCFRDLADNRGSSFRGPRSFFYEAQETLRGDDLAALRRRREAIICRLLAERTEIKEVLLYEAADWLYNLPLSDPDLCGHAFLDDCPHIKADANDGER